MSKGWKFPSAFTVINFSMKNSRKNPRFPVERAGAGGGKGEPAVPPTDEVIIF